MAKKKLHWTQKPENKSKVKRRINKMIKAKTNGKKREESLNHPLMHEMGASRPFPPDSL